MRPHHLLCALTFVGEGYSDAFVANFRAVLARIEAGEAIEIVAGPDDICAPLLADGDPHCILERIAASDELAAHELALDAALRAILAGGTLDAGRVAALREAFVRATIRGACADCTWHALCTAVAQSGYAKSILHANRTR